MCGLFGYTGPSVDTSLLLELARLSGQRGQDACGLAWLAEGVIRVSKTQGATSQLRDRIHEAASDEAIHIIGHARLATSAINEDGDNNQPLQVRDHAIVHNGNVYNADELFAQYGMVGRTRCDSEAIVALASDATIGTQQGNNIRDVYRWVLNQVDRRSPLALLAIARDHFVAARRKHPLWVRNAADGLYFCSMPFDSAKPLQNNTVLCVGYRPIRLQGTVEQTRSGWLRALPNSHQCTTSASIPPERCP